MTNGKSSTSSFTTSYVPKCHTGNSPILTIGPGTLYAGGWSRDASAKGVAVIDLTGDSRYHVKTGNSPAQAGNEIARSAFARTLSVKRQDPKPVIDFHIKDFGTPEQCGVEFWQALAADVRGLLEAGTSVLVACAGGHGRTGMVVSILAGLLAPDQTGDDPVGWVRARHCKDAVEKHEQHRYVHETLGLPEPPFAGYKHQVVVPTPPARQSSFFGWDGYDTGWKGHYNNSVADYDLDTEEADDGGDFYAIVALLDENGVHYDTPVIDGAENILVYDIADPEVPLVVSDMTPNGQALLCLGEGDQTWEVLLTSLVRKRQRVTQSTAPDSARESTLEWLVGVLKARGIVYQSTWVNGRITRVNVYHIHNPKLSLEATGASVQQEKVILRGAPPVAMAELLKEA